MQRPFTAEIIGPAGAGKSTLMAMLRQRDAGLRTGLSLWRLPVSLLAAGAISSLPTISSLVALNWENAKLVIQINAFRSLLRRESAKGFQALLLDEGSVFGLAKLFAFSSNRAGITQRLCDRVAPTIDAVIWLDAPNEILAQRIREREKTHRVKDAGDEDIYKHLEQYRAAFERTLKELSALAPLQIIRFNTNDENLDQIADHILATVNSRIAGHLPGYSTSQPVAVS